MLENESLRQPSLPGFQELFEDSFFEFLPYSNFRRWTPEDGIYDRAFQNLPLGRLKGVKALSFLSYIGLNPESRYFMEYKHTRLDHSLVVALLMEEMLRQNGFSQEKINLGIIAGLVHDIATPAHGDATKKVDPEYLNEEKFWWDVLDKKAKAFIAQHGGSKLILSQIIKDGGALGQVLDIADRITYTMKDLYGLIGPMEKQDLNLDPYLLPLRQIVYWNPKIGNIYKEVGVDQKKAEVFFNDSKGLAQFLLLRALLYKNLYLNPVSQGRDLFVTKLIDPLYSRTDPSLLTPSKLRTMEDQNLMDAVSSYLSKRYKEAIPRPDLIFHTLVNWYPEFERFDDKDKAKIRATQLSKDENIAVIGIKKCNGFDPATSYKVATRNGHIVPFKDAMPEESRQIEQIAEDTKGIFVFYVNLSEKPSPINTLLKAVLKSK